MADKKISALTGATTPLAGTEVLPIVQSGATVKVPVSDLTAGRAVQVGTLNVGASAAPFATGATIKPASDGYQITLLQSNADGAGWGAWADTAGALSITRYGSSAYGTPALKFTVAGLATFSGDVKTGGSFIPTTAGLGINFTANTPAAGMTSQLLNWYEEGTFTFGFTPSTSGSIILNGSYSTGTYTRVGRQVTVTGLGFVSSVSSPVGNLQITGLPFTINNSNAAFGAGSLYVEGISSGTTAWQAKLNKSTTYIECYVTGNANPTASAGVVQANTIIAFTATFFV